MNTPTQPETVTLRDHYNKKRIINARPLTLEELIKNPSHVLFVTHCNTIARAKVTSVKTWKTQLREAGYVIINVI